MKGTAKYFPVVLFIKLYKVILTFADLDEILKCEHTNESHRVVWYCLFCVAGLDFSGCG